MKHTKLPLGAFLFAVAARRCRSQGRIRCTGAHVPAVLPPELCGGSPAGVPQTPVYAPARLYGIPPFPAWAVFLPAAENRGLGRGAPGKSRIRCPGRCCGGRAAAPPAGRALAPQAPKGSAPSRKENAAPIPHIKKIPRRALCLGKDLFCLLRLFFSPLSAGYFSPLPLRPC